MNEPINSNSRSLQSGLEQKRHDLTVYLMKNKDAWQQYNAQRDECDEQQEGELIKIWWNDLFGDEAE